MLSAEKQCKKGKTGHIWSIKLVTAARLVRYWKMCRSYQLNNRPADAYLTKLGINLGIQHCPLTTAAISSQLTKARSSLKTAQSNATQLRDDYLEEMAAQMSEQNHTDTVTIIKNIRHHKEIKQSFKLLQPISKGNQGGAVSTILVPNETGWVPTEDDDDVMARPLHHNQLHLHQRWDTLFANDPVKEYIGDYGLGSGSQDILDGNFDPN
eukprot:15327740-Ditylum_brightwellii.AAC.1